MTEFPLQLHYYALRKMEHGLPMELVHLVMSEMLHHHLNRLVRLTVRTLDSHIYRFDMPLVSSGNLDSLRSMIVDYISMQYCVYDQRNLIFKTLRDEQLHGFPIYYKLKRDYKEIQLVKQCDFDECLFDSTLTEPFYINIYLL